DTGVMIDRMITHHLEVLRSMWRRCVGVVRIEGVHHADAFDWFLWNAVDHIRRLDSGRFQDRRHDVYEMVELVADASFVFDHLRPRDRHALPRAAEVRCDLLGPREWRVPATDSVGSALSERQASSKYLS